MFDASSKIHEAVEQLSRQKSALRLNVENINHDEKTGVINGYNVTLEECSCRDWFIRRLPCKHMYRLAHELGIFELKGKAVNDSAVQSDAEIKMLRKTLKEKAFALPETARKLLYDITRHEWTLARTPEIDEIIKLLLQNKLIVLRQPTEKELYSKQTLQKLRDVCPSAPKSLKKSDLIQYIREKQPEFEKGLLKNFNDNFFIADWPEEYEKARIAVQRAITPYKGGRGVYIMEF